MDKIVAFLHHGLGDVIMALPALWAVDRIGGSGLDLDIVVKSELEASIISSVRWQVPIRLHYVPNASKPTRALKTMATIWRLRRGRPDILVTPHLSNPRAARHIACLVGANVSVLPGQLMPEPGEHKAAYYARFFQKAGVDIDLDHLEFPPLGPRATDLRRLLLAPAVGATLEQHKKWSNKKFAELAGRILCHFPDLHIELIGAPPERPILEDVFKQMPHVGRVRSSIRTESCVRDAAEAMVGAEAIVTACSGASHLAAWAGVPVVGLYGPTNPLFTGPFTQKFYPVHKGYACAPCYRRGFISGCGTPVCIDDISVDDVLMVVLNAIKGVRPPELPPFETSGSVAPDLQVLIARLPVGVALPR